MACTPSEMQARHIAGSPRACICAQLLDHALTRHCWRPASSPAHHYCFSCLAHAMRGALCCEGRLHGSADGQREIGAHVLRASAHGNTALAPNRPSPRPRLPPKYHSGQIWHESPREGNLGGGASGDPTSVRSCTVRRAATTGRTSGNSAVQPTLS